MEARFEQVDARFETTEHKILGTLERELRRQTWRMFAVYAASMGAFIGALVAVADV
jgi:nitrate/nitrite transporter NarK